MKSDKLVAAFKETDYPETEVERSNLMMPLRAAAEKYGLSYYAVRLLALNGEIPAIRIGQGKILVNAAGLESYLSSARLTDRPPEPDSVHGIRVLGR